MWESNPRPLNLQTLKSVAIISPHMRIYDQSSRIYNYIYIANLDCHDLNVSALAPPIISTSNLVCLLLLLCRIEHESVKLSVLRNSRLLNQQK